MPEKRVAGLRLHWTERGEGPSTVWLHSGLSHGGAWQEVTARVHGRRHVCIDLPGHGSSETPEPGVGYGEATVAALADLLDTLRGPFDVVGHSFGGVLALALALQRRDLIQSLALIEPVLFAVTEQSDPNALASLRHEHAKWEAALARGEAGRAAAIFLALWGDGRRWNEISAEAQHDMARRMHLISAQTPVLQHDSLGLLELDGIAALTQPVLLLQGTASPAIIGSVMEALQGRLPRAKRVLIGGAGHMAPRTHAPAVAAEIEAYLRLPLYARAA